MPVVSMNETSWDDSRAMLSHGNMASMRHGSHISKDDAGVSYFFQRPQESNDPGNYSNKKWAVGDDSCLEQVVTSGKIQCLNTWPSYEFVTPNDLHQPCLTMTFVIFFVPCHQHAAGMTL